MMQAKAIDDEVGEARANVGSEWVVGCGRMQVADEFPLWKYRWYDGF